MADFNLELTQFNLRDPIPQQVLQLGQHALSIWLDD